MTIVAIHYTGDEFLAIADGLIRGKDKVLHSDHKLLIFTPVYKIPRISLGGVTHFDEFRGDDFCLGYAGTYSVIQAILTKFLDVTSRQLVLERSEFGGHPTIRPRPDSGRDLRHERFSDNYNFDHRELPEITVSLLMDLLEGISESVCLDFASSVMGNTKPHVQFFVYGSEAKGLVAAKTVQVLKCLDAQYGKAAFDRHSVEPSKVEFLGDESVIPELRRAVEDEIKSSQSAATDQGEGESWPGKMSEAQRIALTHQGVMKRKVLDLILRGTETIGGDATIASARWAGSLSIIHLDRGVIEASLEEANA